MHLKYLTAIKMEKIWNLTSRRISVPCAKGRIESAIKKGIMWMIPSNVKRTTDARLKAKESGQ